MNRLALILSLLVVAAGAIFAGNYHWKQSIEKTADNAKVTLNMPSASKNTTDQSDTTSESSTANGSSTTQQDSSSPSNNSNSQPANGQSGNKEQPADTNSNAGSQSSTDGSASTTSPGTTETSSTNGTGTGVSSPKKKTVEEIKSQYRSLFSELEAAETSKIDQMVVAAKAEYVSKKASKSELAAKYQSAAKQMEHNADSSFYVIYQHLQYDLDKNGYSLNEAQEFQRTYNTKKQEHLNRIVSEVRGF